MLSRYKISTPLDWASSGSDAIAGEYLSVSSTHEREERRGGREGGREGRTKREGKGGREGGRVEGRG